MSPVIRHLDVCLKAGHYVRHRHGAVLGVGREIGRDMNLAKPQPCGVGGPG